MRANIVRGDIRLRRISQRTSVMRRSAIIVAGQAVPLNVCSDLSSRCFIRARSMSKISTHQNDSPKFQHIYTSVKLVSNTLLQQHADHEAGTKSSECRLFQSDPVEYTQLSVASRGRARFFKAVLTGCFRHHFRSAGPCCRDGLVDC